MLIEKKLRAQIFLGYCHGCYPKGSYVEGLFPSVAVFKGGAFGKWLDHGLIPCWIHNIKALLGGDIK
jgi:hypothetical protein